MESFSSPLYGWEDRSLRGEHLEILVDERAAKRRFHPRVDAHGPTQPSVGFSDMMTRCFPPVSLSVN